MRNTLVLPFLAHLSLLTSSHSNPSPRSHLFAPTHMHPQFQLPFKTAAAPLFLSQPVRPPPPPPVQMQFPAAIIRLASYCTHSLGLMLLIGFLCGSLLILCMVAVRLSFADADLRLLARGRHAPNAFQGKVVWITGASQGLGAELALYLARAGAKLVLSSRTEANLENVKASCLAHTQDVLVLPLDLCGPHAKIQAAVEQVDKAFGDVGIDFMIHNAGASQQGVAEETSPEVVEALFQVNTLGPIKLTCALLPFMLARKKPSRIVVVSSIAGVCPSPGQSVYSGCKFGLMGYFTSLAAELSDRHVGVTICCPGPVAALIPGSPRMVWGAKEMILAPIARSSSKMPLRRCVSLIATAAAHGLEEVWIARHPILAVAYLFQMFPRLGLMLLKRVGPKRARDMKCGRSGYDISNMFAGEPVPQ